MPDAREFGLQRAALAAMASIVGLIAVVPILLIGLPFWAVSGLTRLVHAVGSRMRGEPLPWQEILEYEPLIGWKPKPNLNAVGLTKGGFRLTTDAEGWRGRRPLDESDIVALGDSFAFGDGVDERDHFANVDPKLRIKAIGAIGYNLVQELLWMERLAPRLRSKQVVWFIYYGNDLYENLRPNMGRYRMPFVRWTSEKRRWEIVTEHVTAAPWEITSPRPYYDRLAAICSPTALKERAFSACEFLLRRGRDVCFSAGAGLVVLGIPDRCQLDPARIPWLGEKAPNPAAFDPGIPDEEMGKICGRLEIPFRSVSDCLAFTDYNRFDVHWNARGNRRVARLLGGLHASYATREVVDAEYDIDNRISVQELSRNHPTERRKEWPPPYDRPVPDAR